MADVRISELQELDALSGKEMIPCEIDGKNYKITPDQIAPFVDIANIPTFDSITGQEKVIVVRDGKAQGLVTLTQIRQVVLPGYTYEDLSMDKFPNIQGGIDAKGMFSTSFALRNEIPVKKGQVVVIKLVSIELDFRISSFFGFVQESLTGLSNGDSIPYADNGGVYVVGIDETYTLEVPDGAAYLVVDSWMLQGSTLRKTTWDITIGELIDDKLNDLSRRVSSLEQSPAPANISVSREEFDALKRELESLKMQNTAVVGKETI